jgi:hypothetical protein
MRHYLAITALLAGLFGSEPNALGPNALGPSVLGSAALAAEDSAMIELAAPPSASRGEAVELQVSTGQLPRGARLVISDQSGKVLGAVAPFPPGLRANTATVPVPRSAMADGRVRLDVQVVEPGVPPRAPRPGEVGRLELVPLPKNE